MPGVIRLLVVLFRFTAIGNFISLSSLIILVVARYDQSFIHRLVPTTVLRSF